MLFNLKFQMKCKYFLFLLLTIWGSWISIMYNKDVFNTADNDYHCSKLDSGNMLHVTWIPFVIMAYTFQIFLMKIVERSRVHQREHVLNVCSHQGHSSEMRLVSVDMSFGCIQLLNGSPFILSLDLTTIHIVI